MDKTTLKVLKREISGRKVKKLRKVGILPANIFGKGFKSTMVQVDLKDFSKVFAKVGETGLVELQLDDQKIPVLVHNQQVDPVTDQALHADFLQVNLKEKVTASIPVEFVGESSAEKQGLGTVVQYINELEVEALPGDLLDKIEVDISTLTEVEQMILVKDIKVDKSKIEIKDGEDELIAKVEAQKEEKEEVSAPVEGEEVSVEGEQPEANEGEKEGQDVSQEN